MLAATLMVLLTRCSLLLDCPAAPRGPTVAVEGDTVDFIVAAPRTGGDLSMQFRLDDSLTPWTKFVPGETELLVRVPLNRPGLVLVNWRYKTSLNSQSEWSRAALVRVLPAPGWPSHRRASAVESVWSLAVDTGFTRAYAAAGYRIVVYSLPALDIISEQESDFYVSTIGLSPDGLTLYATDGFGRGRVLSTTDFAQLDTFDIESIHPNYTLVSDSGFVTRYHADGLQFYDRRLRAYTAVMQLAGSLHAPVLSPEGQLWALGEECIYRLDPCLKAIISTTGLPESQP